MARIVVTFESTRRRAFARALDWPGWCRAGRDEPSALAALEAAGLRYAAVAAAAGVPFPAAADRAFEAVARHEGNAGTDFGVPSVVVDADRRAVTADEAVRFAALLAAAWEYFDRIAAAAPESLRKGPRGGGRDTSKVVAHVVESDRAYARNIGVATTPIAPTDAVAVAAMREVMLEALRQPSDGSPLAGKKWPYRYAVGYIAWHALDHAWEILDRSEPS